MKTLVEHHAMTHDTSNKTRGWARAPLPITALLVLSVSCGPFTPALPGSPPDMDHDAAINQHTTPSKNAPGEPCTARDDCAEGAACIGLSSGGFECMSYCSNPGGLCASGKACIELPETNGQLAICYAGGQTPRHTRCTSNLECAAGNLCFGDDEARYCLAACDSQTSQGCEPNQTCQTSPSGASYCRDTLGTLCDHAQECPEGYTCSYDHVVDLNGVYTSGACVRLCDVSGECPGDGRCVRANNSSDQRYCLDGCASDAECRFNQQEKCRDATTCSLSRDPSRCNMLTSAGPLCARSL